MDSSRPKWWNWCRLCAKENCQIEEVKDGVQLSLEALLQKQFNIRMANENLLPQTMCGDCNSYLLSLMAFSERVGKVQRMYSQLLASNDSCDFKDIRKKFDILDEYINPPDIVEVVKINIHSSPKQTFTQSTIKDEIKIIGQQDEEPLDEYDVKPLHSVIPCEGEDPLDAVPDLNTYHFSSSNSDDDIKYRLRRKGVSRNNTISIGSESEEKVNKPHRAFIPETIISLTRNHGKKLRRKYKQLDTNEHQHSTSEEEKDRIENLIKRRRMYQRDLNRKRKEEIPIDYSMEGNCTLCNEKFDIFSKYCEHVLKSHVDNQWRCLPCNRKLQSRYDFERHLRKHLPKNSIIKHICTICGLKLSCSTTLNRHLSVHSDKMQHLCEHCGRAFKRDTTLKAHMILHTGLKPYSCNFCQLTFACSSNCRRHMRKAHSEEFSNLQILGNNIKK